MKELIKENKYILALLLLLGSLLPSPAWAKDYGWDFLSAMEDFSSAVIATIFLTFLLMILWAGLKSSGQSASGGGQFKSNAVSCLVGLLLAIFVFLVVFLVVLVIMLNIYM